MSFFSLTGPYRGRFAPTPSGPLHLGSLLTALASWLDARSARGRWLLRIDDLDRARCPPEAETTILRQLEAHGLTWDESPRRQSAHVEEYRSAIHELQAQGLVYRCSCSRARLLREARAGVDGPVYSGRCREAGIAADVRSALRLRAPQGQALIEDFLFGTLTRDIPSDIGDFVLLRSDGVIGYHLACVVDEAAQRISHVVRGADLIGSTLAQRVLQALLDLPSPAYAHVPVLADAHGLKFSKQNHARPVDARDAASNLYEALIQLGQQPPESLSGSPPAELLQWALAHWRACKIARNPVQVVD